MVTRFGWVGLVGCALIACGFDEARITFRATGLDRIGADALEVRFSDGKSRRTLETADFGSLTSGEAGPFHTETSGDLDVEFVLRSGGDTLSAGAVRLELRPDWEWGIRIMPDSADPTRHCFGCFGSKAFAFTPPHAAFDSLYVVWGGNWISDPVVY